MDMNGERRIPAPREKVWQGLNDPDVLKASIPGCETLEKTSDNEFKATASVKIGPIAARFSGKVALTEIDPPNGYRIGGEGQGGVAGFAKGGATVSLADDGEGTLLTYVVQAQVGGKIAQLGARLIDATAKSMAEQFFNRFAAQVAPAAVVVPVVDDAAAGAPPAELPPATPVPIHETAPAVTHEAAPAVGHAAAVTTEAVAAVMGAPSAAKPEGHSNVAPATVSLLSLIPSEIAGYPIVAWIGSLIFLFILILLFGSLL